jgi:hypothetical protein
MADTVRSATDFFGDSTEKGFKPAATIANQAKSLDTLAISRGGYSRRQIRWPCSRCNILCDLNEFLVRRSDRDCQTA